MEAPSMTRSDAAVADSDNIVREYDFKNPGRLGNEKTDQIQLAHSVQARRIGIGLGNLLRDSVIASVEAAEELGCPQLIESIPSTCVAFKLAGESLETNCLIDIDPALAFSFVDRLFGGKGLPLEELRELTSIEKRVMRKAGDILALEIAAIWKPVADLKMTLKQVVSKRDDIEGYPSNESFIVVRLHVKTGAAEGTIRIAYPYTMLAPLLGMMSPAPAATTKAHDKEQVARQLGPVPIPVSATLGISMIGMRDVLNVERGDVLVLDNHVTDEVIVSVGGRMAFWGRPGSHKGKLAVKITRIFKEGGKENEPCR
jgi:flagellar motor switch protein FliM